MPIARAAVLLRMYPHREPSPGGGGEEGLYRLFFFDTLVLVVVRLRVIKLMIFKSEG